MQLEFGRSITSVADPSLRREWLVTNGIGGYACGTLNLARTRVYHSFLTAPLQPPTQRQVLLATIDAWLESEGTRVPLTTHQWASGIVLPDGYRNLESFHLEGTLPLWHWTYGNVKLIQRLWMEHGKNTSYISYTYTRGDAPIQLRLKPLITYRNHHDVTQGGDKINLNAIHWAEGKGIDILPHRSLSEQASGSLPQPFRILSNSKRLSIEGNWWWSFYLSAENDRGLEDQEALYQVAELDPTLQVGETVVLIATFENEDPPPWRDSLAAEQQRQRELLALSKTEDSPAWVRGLVLAADQFVVDRKIGSRTGKSIIAGYPWFSDWGRDTMIALPGLTLSTRRYAVAASVLRTYAEYVSEGMLPNRFPDGGGAPEYNTVDATLWYFVALYQYLQVQAQDMALAAELYPTLLEIIAWHRRGTRYHIRVDRSDHLLYQGEPDMQLTWMDVKVEDWVVTPRQGKPVEINALWYNALRIMAWLAEKLGHADDFSGEALLMQKAFRAKFWYAEGGYLYDVIDGPQGPDASLRPNQLFALALPFPLLEGEQARQVLDICARQLVTSYGLRSLSPQDDAYVRVYGGGIRARDGAYHQGTVWSWLMGAFVRAHYRVYGDRDAALDYLRPFAQHLQDACVGSISEIFDGDAPHSPRGAFAQAWSVAEILRAWLELEQAAAPALEQR